MTPVQEQRLTKAWETVQAARRHYRELAAEGRNTAADLARMGDAEFAWQSASRAAFVTATPRASYAFMVWRKSKGRPPRFRHETIEAATGEAERLAAANPGATFVVLQEIARFTATEPAAAMPPAVEAEPGDHAPRSPGSNGEAP